MEVREKHGVQTVVHHQAEAALRSEVAEFHVKHVIREGTLEFLDVLVGVSAFPCVEDLKVRPVVLWKHGSVFLLEGPQFGGALRVRFHAGFQFGPDLRRDVQLGGYGAVLYVVHILVEILVHIVLQFDYGGRVSCDDDAYVLLYAHTHQDIIP